MDSVPWPSWVSTWDASVPAQGQNRLVLHMAAAFVCDTGPVTSLSPAPGSPITVKRCGTSEDASVGDLELNLDLSLSAVDTNAAGFKVAKGFVGGRMALGPVVERLVAGPGISFSKSASAREGQGVFTISADGAEYSGDFSTVSLENAKLASVGMFPYTRLLGWSQTSKNVQTGFVVKFHVPSTAVASRYSVRFYATVFGEESFEGGSQRFAGIGMEYGILPDYVSADSLSSSVGNLKDALVSSASPADVDIPLGRPSGDSFSYSAYDPVLVHNDPSLGDVSGVRHRVLDGPVPFADDVSRFNEAHPEIAFSGVRPGSTVAVRFFRKAPKSGEAYEGPIGFLNMRWSLEEVVDERTAVSEETDKAIRDTVAALRSAAAVPTYNMTTVNAMRDVLVRLIKALR